MASAAAMKQAVRRAAATWFWALLGVYGPFAVAAAITWLFVPCPHCKLMWAKYLVVSPGSAAIFVMSVLTIGQPLVIPGIIGWLVVATATATLVVGLGLLMRLSGRAKWILLAVSLSLSTYGAAPLFALIRA